MKTFFVLLFLVGAGSGLHAQSATGKWLGTKPGGPEIALDLIVAGTNLTGRVVSLGGGQALSLPLIDGKIINGGLRFSVQTGPERAAFSGELASNEISLRMILPDPTGPAIILKRVEALPAAAAPVLSAVSAPTGWQAFNRAAQFVEEGTRRVVRVDARPNDGVIWVEGSDLKEGSILLELRGTNAPQQSFLGVAFRGADDTNYDAVYFRPFNFQAADPARQRAVQYVSHPEYPWMKLRTDSPGKYEQPVSPVPDPNGWFRARIQIDGDDIKVFVNDSPTPALSVTALSKRQNGKVGFWVGNNSGGDFASLRLLPK